jgi:uncharacterized protein (TIGR03545 family)
MIVVVVVVLLRWGLGPVASYATIRGLESATGAKVEIGETRVGLFPPSVHFSDLHVADPRSDKEMRDAISADSVELILDGDALLHRRLIASNGRINGLQVGAKRLTSGHIVQQQEPEAEQSGPSVLARLLGAATHSVAQQADAVVDGLETVQRGKEIRDRWEQEYEGLIVRARNLEKQIRDVRDRARGIDNPLRDWPEFERTLADARDARNELLTVHQELNSLPQRLQVDLAQLDEAKRIDVAKVDQFVPGDLSGTSEFGIDIMASAVREQIQQVRSYLDGGRAIANYTVVAPEHSRIRGVYFDLEQQHRPQIMVRRCEIGGVMRADGDIYSMSGVVENLTPTPELLEEPTRTRLTLEGPQTLRVEFVRDRRDNANVDLLTMHWPTVDAQPIRLGDDDEAGISVAGGQRELWVQLRSEHDQIEGRLVSKQTGVTMDLSVDPKYAQTAAVSSLRESLSVVDRIEIDARFAGTWKDIDLEMNTNLGQIMRRAAHDAIDGQMRETRQQLTAKIDKAHADQTSELRDWLAKQQGEALSLLASADKSIEEMSAKVLNEVGVADEYLGKLRGAVRGKLR